MKNRLYLVQAGAMLLLSALGCGAQAPGPVIDETLPGSQVDDHASSTVLEGKDAISEMQLSPVRTVPEGFVRLGFLFDGPPGVRLEVSTSADGGTWSNWAPVRIHSMQAGPAVAYVGSYEVPAGTATRYRLRAAAGGSPLPTFLSVEPFRTPLPPQVTGPAQPEAKGTLTIGGVPVNARSAWGAKAPTCVSNDAPYYRITIHDTESPNTDTLTTPQRLRAIQDYHQQVKGWCDIGYHVLVSRDGQLWQGRELGHLGAHTEGNNTGNAGISFIGNYMTLLGDSAQVTSVYHLVRALHNIYGVALDRTAVKGHRQYKDTTCPGDSLFGQIDTIVQKAKTGP